MNECKNPLTACNLAEVADQGAYKKTPLWCSFVGNSNTVASGFCPKAGATAVPAHRKRSVGAGTGGASAWALALLCSRFCANLTAALTVSPYGNHGENNTNTTNRLPVFFGVAS
jgi:hypothetical protein